MVSHANIRIQGMAFRPRDCQYHAAVLVSVGVPWRPEDAGSRLFPGHHHASERDGPHSRNDSRKNGCISALSASYVRFLLVSTVIGHLAVHALLFALLKRQLNPEAWRRPYCGANCLTTILSSSSKTRIATI